MPYRNHFLHVPRLSWFTSYVQARLRPLDLGERRGEGGKEADAFAFTLYVVVTPLTLVAGDLDREVGGRSVLLRDHHLGHGPGAGMA